jgi:hypothetical protein
MSIKKNIFITLLLVLSTTSTQASKEVVVDLTHQTAIAYQDGEVKFYGRISSGKPGRETPTGHFYIIEKERMHVSNLWPAPNGGAKMPYMMRITRDGIAMHLGPTPNHPASHGCIRLRNGFAQRMFAWADRNIPVRVIGKAPRRSPAVRLYRKQEKKSTTTTSYKHLTTLEILSGRFNHTSKTKKENTKRNKAHKRVDPLKAMSSR